MSQVPVGFYFKVQFMEYGVTNPVDSPANEAFQEVSGLSMSVQTEPYYAGGMNDVVFHLPQSIQYGNLQLKRGLLTSSSPLLRWCKSSMQAGMFNIKVKNILISLMNPATKEESAQWLITGAYPIKYEVSGFNAMENGYMVENIEMVYQKFEQVKSFAEIIIETIKETIETVERVEKAVKKMQKNDADNTSKTQKPEETKPTGEETPTEETPTEETPTEETPTEETPTEETPTEETPTEETPTEETPTEETPTEETPTEETPTEEAPKAEKPSFASRVKSLIEKINAANEKIEEIRDYVGTFNDVITGEYIKELKKHHLYGAIMKSVRTAKLVVQDAKDTVQNTKDAISKAKNVVKKGELKTDEEIAEEEEQKQKEKEQQEKADAAAEKRKNDAEERRKQREAQQEAARKRAEADKQRREEAKKKQEEAKNKNKKNDPPPTT